jgi:putative transcriptional regulator
MRGDRVELYNRLKERRRENELTQEALAHAVGVTRQTIIAIEQGKHEPSVRLALEIASVLGASIDDLFWLSGGNSKGEKRE